MGFQRRIITRQELEGDTTKDDSDDDFRAAPVAQQQPGVSALLGDLDSDDSEDDGDYDDAGSDDIGDSWLLNVAEPFSSVFASTLFAAWVLTRKTATHDFA